MKTQHSATLTLFILSMLLLLVFVSCEDPASSNNNGVTTSREWSEITVDDAVHFQLYPHDYEANTVFMVKTDADYHQSLLRSRDYGMTWEPILDGFIPDLVVFTGEAPDFIYLLGDYLELNETQWPRLWVSRDGGNTADTVSNFYHGESTLLWVDPLDRNHLWASTGSMWEWSNLRESEDGGISWKIVHEEYFSTSVSAEPRRVYQILFDATTPERLIINAAGANGGANAQILSSEDGFDTFQVLRDTGFERCGLVHNLLRPAQLAYGVMSNRIQFSQDAGASWSEIQLQVPDVSDVRSIRLLGDSLFALTENGFWAMDMESNVWTTLREFDGSASIHWSVNNLGVFYLADSDYGTIYVYH